MIDAKRHLICYGIHRMGARVPSDAQRLDQGKFLLRWNSSEKYADPDRQGNDEGSRELPLILIPVAPDQQSCFGSERANLQVWWANIPARWWPLKIPGEFLVSLLSRLSPTHYASFDREHKIAYHHWVGKESIIFYVRVRSHLYQAVLR
jgi:hypothetical protein